MPVRLKMTPHSNILCLHWPCCKARVMAGVQSGASQALDSR
jgi:hypothetical protein